MRSTARENRDRLEWARARFLDAATETVCVVGDPKALKAALDRQTEANEDWQVAQIAMAFDALEPDDSARLKRMDALRKAEARHG
jgi:hypothetical protein